MIKTKAIYGAYRKSDEKFLGELAQKIGLPAPEDTEDVKFLYAGSE